MSEELQQEINALRRLLLATKKQLGLSRDCLTMIGSRLQDLLAEPTVKRHQRVETSLQYAIQEIRNTLPQENKNDDDD